MGVWVSRQCVCARFEKAGTRESTKIRGLFRKAFSKRMTSCGCFKTVRSYRDIIRTSIKRKDVQFRLISLLELLKRYSCKQLGVSYMCKNTIADVLELSYKTIQRLMKKLVDLGIIKQIFMKRKKI